MPSENSLPEDPSQATPEAIPPLDERSTRISNSGLSRRPIFATEGSHRILRVTPQPPVGPPPPSALSSPSSATNVLETKLPGIVSPRQILDNGPSLAKRASLAADAEEESTKKTLGSLGKRESGRRIGNMTGQSSPQSPSVKLVPLAEATETEEGELFAHKSNQESPANVENGGLEAKLPSKVEQAARKAHRMAEIRSIAQEVARTGKKGGDAESENGEIERALAAVDETRRKRMERNKKELSEPQQDEEKLRRRRERREHLMKKRKKMEDRLEEEANKMAELTETTKKKGETRYMSEEAKRDAEERIQAETEVVARLERQVAEMALRRENMQREIQKASEAKAAEIEKESTSALQAKRALVEARIREQEKEIKNISEAAKRKVEAKMAAEAAAIAEMERRAQQMTAKREQLEALEAQMSDRIEQQHQNALEQEAELTLRKREELKENMRQEEAELQKLTEEAKRRVQEKMALEAAAIAEMEREANKLAKERATMESQMAHSSKVVRGADRKNDREIENGGINPEPTAALGLTTTAPTAAAVAAVAAVAAADVQALAPTSASASASASAACPEDGKRHASIDQVSNAEGSPTPVHPAEKDPTIICTDVCIHCRIEKSGMSPAHMAAANGHVSCLEALEKSQQSALLLTPDSSGRSPLFYACANARDEAAEVLIRAGPQICEAMDVNQDTPLHAAALAGSASCCRLLLEEGQCDAEPVNATHMTPAHLAANNDVLEVLSQYGVNMNAKDADSRTPLFTACAYNHLEKAEFLCELVECAGQDLGETDKRGDTPMHAAAYNGSTACLLLLLQYGVKPDIRNLKGLRPIDLASRKQHSACEKILMEYQLHHQVDNTIFDSVLFLATLEGHKKCKEVLTKNPEPAEKAQQGSSLVRPESLWSLRRERSVRLEHWGDWIAYQDQNAQTVFWYNHVAQKTQLEEPSGIRHSSTKTLGCPSMRLKREGDWIEYTLPDGNVFYYNEKSNDFQWERPDQVGESSSERHGHSNDADTDGKPDAHDGVGADASPIVGDWAAFQDPSTGLVFWYNQVSGESRWEPPEDFKIARGEAPPDRGKNSMTPDEDVREVTSVDELFV